MVDEKRLYLAVGQKIRKIREDQSLLGKKLTQGKLADDVGLERTSITNIEQGNQKLPLHILYRICNALNVPLEAVLPPLSEVRGADPNAVAEVSFYGQTLAAPPLVAEALARYLNTEDEHENVQR